MIGRWRIIEKLPQLEKNNSSVLLLLCTGFSRITLTMHAISDGDSAG